MDSVGVAPRGGATTKHVLLALGLPCPRAPQGVPLQKAKNVFKKTRIYGIALQTRFEGLRFVPIDNKKPRT
jgi:hypothetical protein